MLMSLNVTMTDFREALASIQPSALREVFVERPNVHWNDIGGLEEVKAELKEAVELPVKNPEAFERIGIRPVKGILLVGAPGTGKTLLAKTVATERESNFISIKGPEFLSKYVGESEKAVRGGVQEGQDGIAVHNIHRRDRLDSICEEQRQQRFSCYSARGRHAPHRDGRPVRHEERIRACRNEQA